MTFDPIRNPVDVVFLGGERTPGIATIEGAGSPRRWDERRGYGLSGGTLVFRGVGLAQFKIILRLYTSQDFADWESFAPVVQRPPLGERARALDISHPITDALGIRSVVIEDVKAPALTHESGEWTVEIAVREYRRPLPALSVPAGSQATPATDPVDQEIERLAAQVQVLAS